MRRGSESENPMPPYDFVSRQDYEAQRDQRLLLDDLPQGEQVVMRYSGRDKRPNFYAADYLVCIRGITRARNLNKVSEVQIEPVALDYPPPPRAIGYVKVNKDDFVVVTRRVVFSTKTAERGYFLNLPDAQILPQSETWTPPAQWNRNLGVRLVLAEVSGR